MSLTSASRLLAGAAVTAGLALGGLPTGAAVAAPSAPSAARATAVGATASYSCVNPLLGGLPAPLNTLGSFTLPASFSLQNLPDVLTANVPVPGGVPFIGSFDFTGAGLTGLLTSLQLTAVNGLAGTPLAQVGTLLNGALTPVVNGVATFEQTLGTFTPGTTGLPLPIPTSFDAGLLTPVLGLLGVKCTLVPGSITPTTPPGGGGGGGGGTGGGGTGGGGLIIGPGGVILTSKQTAKVKAKGVKVIRVGQRAVVKVGVKTSANQAGVGDVVAKLGGKKVTKTLKNGKVRFVFKGLEAGVRKIKISFAGNSYTESAKKTFTVTVRR